MAVFVLDRRKKPLMPCSEKRARLLLARGRARVHRLNPFTIRLVDRAVETSVLQPVRVKLDPGSRTTGVAVVREDEDNPARQTVLHLAELAHRGGAIRDRLTRRAAFRRRRRSANLRNRPPRFRNRVRSDRWLAPSLRHRLETTASWVARYRRFAPVAALSIERVRFDTQAIERPGIAGVDYQRGDLWGYEVREYVLERDGRACAYCGVTDVVLNLDHVVPRARGGSDRPSNLTTACVPCNERKGARSVQDFLAGDPKRLAAVRARLRRPLADATAVNATRWAIWRDLTATGLPVEAASGGRTKWNRSRLDVPKTHALDAACVGTTDAVAGWRAPVLAIKATGRGRYARANVDRHGLPRGHATRTKTMHGFRTGDHVRAIVPKGKHMGTHVGRVAVRASGRFALHTLAGWIDGIGHKHCRLLARADGYGYGFAPDGARPATRSTFFLRMNTEASAEGPW